jgi:hypothetical protein
MSCEEVHDQKRVIVSNDKSVDWRLGKVMVVFLKMVGSEHILGDSNEKEKKD